MDDGSPTDSLEAERMQNARAMERANAQIASMRASLSMLTASSSQVATVLEQRNQEYNALVARLGELKRHSDALRTELDLAVTERDGFREQVNQRNAQLVDLHSQVEKLQAELATVTAAKAALETQVAEALATLDSRDSQVEELTASLSDLRDRLQGAEAAKSALEKQLSESESDLDEYEREMAGLAGQIRVASAPAAELEPESARAGDAVAEAPAARRAAAAAALASGVDALIAQDRRKSAELEETAGRASSLDKQVNSLTSAHGELAASLENKEQAIVDMHAEVDRLNSRVADLETQLAAALEFEKASGLATSLSTMPPWKRNAATAAIIVGAHPQLTDKLQGFSRVKGIGRTSRRRLYNAGIGTYWELASLEDDEMRQIMALLPRQLERVSLADVRSEAHTLAHETGAVGHLWCGDKIDDFEGMGGIGRVFEERLYEAGIHTYEQLAGATVEQLAEICHAPEMRKPDYAEWIRSAQQLLEGHSASASATDAPATGSDGTSDATAADVADNVPEALPAE